MAPQAFHSHPKINWMDPARAAEKQELIEQFERTLPALLAKLDEIAPYVEVEGVEYHQVRGHLVTRAYTDAWGLQGSTAILAVFVSPDPSDESAFDHAFGSAGSRWGVDLGDTFLLDTGVVTLKDYFSAREEELEKELQQTREKHPRAEIQRLKGGVVAGLSRSPGWNHEAIAHYLRGLLDASASSRPSSLH